jgi:hypothetical protein
VEELKLNTEASIAKVGEVKGSADEDKENRQTINLVTEKAVLKSPKNSIGIKVASFEPIIKK